MKTWNNFVKHFVFTLLFVKYASAASRQKRNLIFPTNANIVQESKQYPSLYTPPLLFPPTNYTRFKIILGTGVPIPLEDNQAMTMGWVLKAAYFTPSNASYFTNPYVTLQKRSIEPQHASRFDLYRSIESALKMIGGKGCVLRAICEAARTPFKGAGILSKILHIIFTPSSTDELPIEPGDGIYETAAMIGSQHEIPCSSAFPECQQSVLDILSVTA